MASNNENNTSNINNVTNEYEKKLDIAEDKLNIFYFYVGQADCILIALNGQYMLIDAGNDTDGYHIAKFLKAQGITELDYLIGTHADADHIGGMDTILKQIYVHNLYIPLYNDTDGNQYNQSLNALAYNSNNELKISTFKEDDKITFGDATFDVLSARSIESVSDINNTSIVLQLNYKEKKYLFTGDMEAELENDFLDKDQKDDFLSQIDILKVSHHASNSGTTKEFLNEISPKYAIISSGSNDSRFPDSRCLKSILSVIDIENIYFNERDGTIWVISDGISDDIIKEMNTINLDGAESEINPYELNNEFLESIREKYAFFFIKY